MTPDEIILANRRMIEQFLGRPMRYRSDNPAFAGKSFEEMNEMIEDAEYMEHVRGFKNDLKSVDFL